MLQKTVTLITCFLLGACLHAQVTMTLQVPPSGVMQKNQLWNMVLVYTGDVPKDVYIELSLLDTRDNRPAMTGVARKVTLTKGAKQIQAADVSPVQYEYLSPAFNVDRNPNGLLPIGNFTACYVISAYNGENKAILAEDCIPVEVAPLSPPLLNTPADEAILETQYPQFNWLPPAPLNLFNDLSYDALVVEVRTGQSSTEAIQQNIPVISSGNNRTLFLNYPSSNKALDTGKVYAWRVIAKNNNQFVAQSEVWTFKIGGKTIKTPIIENGAYFKLKRESPSSYVTTSGGLKIEYNNMANDSSVHYRIVSADDPKGGVLKDGIFSLKYGQNFIDLTLDKVFTDKRMYLLQLTNSRREVWNMMFMYVVAKDKNND